METMKTVNTNQNSTSSGSIKVNFEQVNSTKNYISQQVSNLNAEMTGLVENDLSFLKNLGDLNIEKISNAYNGLKGNVTKFNSIPNDMDDVNLQYGNNSASYSGQPTGGEHKDAVDKSYKSGQDGYDFNSKDTSHSLAVRNTNNDNTKIYYSQFSQSWINEAMKNDPEFKRLFNRRYNAFEAARETGNGYASTGASRSDAVSELESADAALIEYCKKNGYPYDIFSSGTLSSNGTNYGGSTSSGTTTNMDWHNPNSQFVRGVGETSKSYAGTSSGNTNKETIDYQNDVKYGGSRNQDGYSISGNPGSLTFKNVTGYTETTDANGHITYTPNTNQGTTFYTGNGSSNVNSQVSSQAANDSEFRQVWNSYYSKYEAARSQSDGWASNGGNRSEAINDVYASAAKVEQYMRTHGHPDFKISDTDLSGYYSENI